MTRPARPGRDAFATFRPIQTRWADNDVYRHVNNVVYYGYFDTAVNGWLIEKDLLVPGESPVYGIVVETGCTFFESVAFPQALEAGIAVARLGETSVTYAIGIFRAGGALACAAGRFTHVYVDGATQRPTRIPEPVRAALEGLAVP
ncbi:acyl-CoA thioesterase [Salinarimonas sp.]|uniref:acyl-CoA thioesterase n=1 Tax=Salinarimonas sp. TaxID=2766526 RepID=UPI003918E3FA